MFSWSMFEQCIEILKSAEQSKASVTDEMVERAAVAQHDKHAEIFGADTWRELHGHDRQRLRPGIRAGLEAALETIQALQPTRATITVNMREHQVEGATISYEQIAQLIKKPGANHLTVTYERGGVGGSLIPGESVPLSDGMHFCATSTSNA